MNQWFEGGELSDLSILLAVPLQNRTGRVDRMAHCWPYSRDDPVEELPGMRVFLAAYGAVEADLETSDLRGHTLRESTLAH